MSTKKFKPKVIGQPDHSARENLREQYENIVSVAIDLQASMGNFFAEYSDRSISENIQEIMDFIKSENPKKWIIEKYAKAKGIKIEGIKTEKLIENDMIDAPDTSELIKYWEKLNQYLTASILKKNKFFYPLEDLFVQDGAYFELSEDFDKKLKDATEIKTTSERENEILLSIEKIATGFNELKMHGLISSETNLLNEASNKIVHQGLVIDKENKEFIPDPRIFIKRRFTDNLE